MRRKTLQQLLLGAGCIMGPVLLREQLADVPHFAALFGMLMGLAPLIFPSRPTVQRPDLEQALQEVAREDRLTEQQVERLRQELDRRIRRPALRFRVLAAGILYLAVFVIFMVLLVIAKAMGRAHPLLLWWTGGFLWALLGSVVWTAIWGGVRPKPRGEQRRRDQSHS